MGQRSSSRGHTAWLQSSQQEASSFLQPLRDSDFFNDLQKYPVIYFFIPRSKKMKPETDWGRRLRVQDMRPTQQTLKMARSDWRGRICHTKIGRDALKNNRPSSAPQLPSRSHAPPAQFPRSSQHSPRVPPTSLPRCSHAAPTPLPRPSHSAPSRSHSTLTHTQRRILAAPASSQAAPTPSGLLCRSTRLNCRLVARAVVVATTTTGGSGWRKDQWVALTARVLGRCDGKPRTHWGQVRHCTHSLPSDVGTVWELRRRRSGVVLRQCSKGAAWQGVPTWI